MRPLLPAGFSTQLGFDLNHWPGDADYCAAVSWRAVMSYSMYGADRGTHLKIVVVGLLCATLVAFVGIFAHVKGADLGTTPIVRAGQPTLLSGGLPTLR